MPGADFEGVFSGDVGAVPPDRAEVIRQADAARADYARTGAAAAADRAVRLWDAVVAVDPRADHLAELGDALLDRYEVCGDGEDLRRARHACTEAVRQDRDPAFLNNLGNCLRLCHSDLADPGALGEACDVLEESVSRTVEDDQDRLVYQDNLALVLAERFAVSGSFADLWRACRLHEEVVARVSPEDENFALFHNNFGGCALEMFTRSGDDEHLARAAEAFQAAVDHTPEGAPELPMRLANLAGAWHDRYDLGDRSVDLDDIVELAERAVRLSPPGAADLPRRLCVLGDTLRARYDATVQVADIDRAIECYRRAGSEPSAHTRAVRDNNLALACLTRYERQGRSGDLELAVEAAERAVAGLPDGAPLLALCQDTLASAWLARYRHGGHLDSLHRAVDVAGQSARRTSSADQARPGRLRHLGAALAHRWYALGNPADLHASVEAVAAVAGAPENTGTPGSATASNDYGVVLRDRYEHTGDPADLDESVRHLRMAVHCGEKARLPPYLDNLGHALSLRYARTGLAADLDEGIRTFVRAATLRAETGQAGAGSPNHAGLLLEKFERSGDLEHLEEALSEYRETLAETPPNAPARAGLVNDLGNALRVRFEHTGSESDLDQATVAFRRALGLVPPSAPARATYLDNLANCLVDRYRTGRDPALLDEAVETFTAALTALPGSTPGRARVQANLAGARWHRWTEHRDESDLESAIDTFREVLAHSDVTASGSARWLNNLAVAVAARYHLHGDPADLAEATETYRAACTLGAETDARWSLMAARNWGRWAMERQDWAGAARAHRFGRNAVNLLFTTQNRLAHKETWLRQATGLAVESAVTAVRLGTSEDAVLALEENRARVLAEALALDSADLAGTRGEDRVGQPNPFDEIRAARREFDEVVAEIREVPGHRDFLAEPTFEDIALAARDRTLCYLTAADDDGLALVVDGDRVVSIPLPRLTTDAVYAAVSAHLDGYRAFRARGEAAAEPWAAELDKHMRWLWDAAMEPVLGRAGAGTKITEITVIAGGLLGLLPLHAAWCPDESTVTGRRYAIDLAAISYVPNARSLTAARERAARVGSRRLLAVADPQPLPEGMEPLKFARLEADAVTTALPAGPVALAGEDATAGRVRAELASAEVLHFACHGFADLVSPLDSHLVLAGGARLTLRDLLALKVDARLAVLSACETAMPGTELPDEVLGLPTGLLQAGAAGVVASGWAVHDLSTAMTMTDFYRRWLDGDEPAEALRQAQRWIRDSTNEDKLTMWRTMPGLPAEVLEHFEDELSLREEADRDESPIHRWAAFQHIGV